MIERFQSGKRMSQAVRAGGIVWLAGQVGEGSTVAQQTASCLASIDALLKEAGSRRENIVQAVIWLADMADFAEMNGVWDAWVPAGHAPARATGEAKLAAEKYRVEIIVTAVVDG